MKISHSSSTAVVCFVCLFFVFLTSVSSESQIVAVVVKYADNVLKGFATSLSILMSCLVSFYLFGDVHINSGFLLGACVVVLAAVAFGWNPQTVAIALSSSSPKAMST